MVGAIVAEGPAQYGDDPFAQPAPEYDDPFAGRPPLHLTAPVHCCFLTIVCDQSCTPSSSCWVEISTAALFCVVRLCAVSCCMTLHQGFTWSEVSTTGSACGMGIDEELFSVELMFTDDQGGTDQGANDGTGEQYSPTGRQLNRDLSFSDGHVAAVEQQQQPPAPSSHPPMVTTPALDLPSGLLHSKPLMSLPIPRAHLQRCVPHCTCNLDREQKYDVWAAAFPIIP